MVWDAERRGLLGPGKELVEATSGNTGIALAFVAAARNLPLTLTMPDTMSIERRKLLIAYGAKLVLTEGAKGMNGAIAKAEEIKASAPDRYVLLQQFKNPANPAIHERRPGRKYGTTPKARSIFLCQASAPAAPSPESRATSSAPKESRLFRSRSSRPRVPCSGSIERASRSSPPRTRFRVIGAGFVPEVLDLSLVDEIEPATNEESIHYALRLAREEGIISGISSGAAVAVAARIAKRPQNAGKTIVVVLPDSGERYLSTALFEGLFDS